MPYLKTLISYSVALSLCSPILPAASRWAFVVGVDDYAKVQRLDYAVSDKDKIARALEETGFKVTSVTNPTYAAFQDQWVAFLKQFQPGDIGLLYFAGHGLQQNNANYLLMQDYDAATGLTDKVVRVDQWIKALADQKPALKIVILDACRNSPLKNGTNGLASMENPAFGQGTYIIYATSPGRVATEQVFARFLSAEMRKPGELLPQVYSAVADSVQKETSGAQTPFQVSSGAVPDFYFSMPERVGPLELAESGQCEQAVPGLNKLIAADPNDGMALMALASCQARMGKLVEAQRTLDLARNVLDRPYLVETELARIALQKGEILDAKQRVQAALDDQPDYAPALILRARILIKTRDYRQATNLLNGLFQTTGTLESCQLLAEALKLDGSVSEAQTQRARCEENR